MPAYEIWLARWRPPLANEWRNRHWSVGHRLRKRAAERLYAEALVRGVPAARGKRRLAVVARLSGGQRAYDRDGPLKLLLDALVGSGLLLGDDAAGLDGLPSIAFERTTREHWGTLLVLGDVE